MLCAFLPFPSWYQTPQFTREIDPRRLAQPQVEGPVGERVYPGSLTGLIEVDITGFNYALEKVDFPVTAYLPVPVGPAPVPVETRAEELFVGIKGFFHEGCCSRDNFEGGSWGVDSLNSPVLERMGRVLEDLIPPLPGDPQREFIGIEAGLTYHRQYSAGLHIHYHSSSLFAD